MLLAPILSLAVIVTTVLLVVLTEATPAAKLIVTAVCVTTFLAPRVLPSATVVMIPVKALLSIAIIVYLKQQHVTGKGRGFSPTS